MTNRTASLTTLTMNPAVERDLVARDIVFDAKVRCKEARAGAGGGGLHVACIMKRLGGDPVAVFPSGGINGLVLERLLAAEGVRHQCFAIAGECRTTTTASERHTGRQIRLVTASPRLSEEEWTAGLGLMTAASASGYAVASGSLPPGVPSDFYARLARNLRGLGRARLVLDASGAELKHALDAGVYLVRLNPGEFAGLIGESAPDRAACRAAAKKLVSDGRAEIVAVTMWPDGAMLVSRDVSLFAKAPKVTERALAGASGAFLAAMTLWLARGHGLEEALRHAVAADTAATLPPDFLVRLSDPIARLAPEVRIETL